jgi:hypothetical protein
MREVGQAQSQATSWSLQDRTDAGELVGEKVDWTWKCSNGDFEKRSRMPGRSRDTTCFARTPLLWLAARRNPLDEQAFAAAQQDPEV